MIEKVERKWGHYIVYDEDEHNKWKLKKLVIYPNKSISVQKHKYRSEDWKIINGTGKLLNGEVVNIFDDIISINNNELHSITNIGDVNLEIIEIQYGEKCEEDDIIRYKEIDEDAD